MRLRPGAAKCFLATLLGISLLVSGCGRAPQEGKSKRPRIASALPLRPGLAPGERLSAVVDPGDFQGILAMYGELTGRSILSSTNGLMGQVDAVLGNRFTLRSGAVSPKVGNTGIVYHRDGRLSAMELKEDLEGILADVGLKPVPAGAAFFQLQRVER